MVPNHTTRKLIWEISVNEFINHRKRAVCFPWFIISIFLINTYSVLLFNLHLFVEIMNKQQTNKRKCFVLQGQWLEGCSWFHFCLSWSWQLWCYEMCGENPGQEKAHHLEGICLKFVICKTKVYWTLSLKINVLYIRPFEISCNFFYVCSYTYNLV